MVKRRSLTPATGQSKGGVHATRRGSGGARREAADRIVLRREGAELTGWALNISRGGIRVILEDKAELGQEYEVEIGNDDSAGKRRGRVVWVQEESDGMIVGVKFTDLPPEMESEPPESDARKRV
jgi:hypothetical protein